MTLNEGDVMKRMMIGQGVTRRGFLAVLPGLVLLAVTRGGWGAEVVGEVQRKHPTPRRGINASRVVAARDLDDDAEVRHAFGLVRQIPQVVDGIRCSCGCDEMKGFYSLLSCFEKDGMAQHCEVCQGHARLAYRLHRAGKSLKQIRAAIDAEYR